MGSLSFSYAWFDGATPISGATATTYTTAASDAGQTVSCKVTATGGYATATAASANGAVLTAVPVTFVPGTGTRTGTSTPVAKPKITSFSESTRRWLTGRAKGKLTHGTRFHLTVSTAATVSLTFTRAESGRRVGRKCLAVTKADKRKTHCTRSVTLGTLKLSAQAGARTITFTGKLGHSTLAPGSYTVTARAHNTAGTAAPRKLAFTVLRP